MTQFADRHAVERKSVSLSEALEPLDRFNNLTGRRRCLRFVTSNRTMDGILKQTGGVRIDLHPLRCGLASEFRLNFLRVQW